MSSNDDSGERLREAACVGDLTLLSKLQSQGVDVNSKNSTNGWTALHWASKRNHVAVVCYLLEKGADKDAQNKDGHVPAQLTSNEEIRQLLGGSAENEVKSSLPITPNYIANPVFPYASKDRDNSAPLNSSSTFSQNQRRFTGWDSRSNSYPAASNGYDGPSSGELVLKVRLANSDEKDFIEVELDHTSLSFSSLLNLMCAELGVDKNLVAKIRKLPDTIVRKDKDVKRMRDFQELELVLTNKAMSSASRTYSLGPAKNHETILY